jgi:hypothetical protein
MVRSQIFRSLDPPIIEETHSAERRGSNAEEDKSNNLSSNSLSFHPIVVKRQSVRPSIGIEICEMPDPL